MTGISKETHEFRQGDTSCLFSTIRYLIQNVKGIDNKSLCKLVKDKIHQREKLSKNSLCNGANENNEVIKKTCGQIEKIKTTDKENELEALVLLCRIIFCVVFITKNDQVTSSVYVHYYGRNLSFQECAYIIYHETSKQYAPLYLFNKSNPDESKTTFDRNDNTIKSLLEQFFKEHLKYHKPVQLDDQIDTKASDVLPRVQNESGNIPGIIVLNAGKDTSKKQMEASGDECLLLSSSTTKTFDTSEGVQVPSNMKINMSNTTHEFRIGELPGDDQCLFSSCIYLFDRSQSINIKSLRKRVANVIRESKDIDDIHLLYNTNCQTREDYCRKIEEGAMWDSEPERHALADLYPNNLFCIISKIDDNRNESSIHIGIYVKDISSYTKCIIIFYDAAANNYAPLYLYDKINHEEEKTIFKYNDTVKKLLEEFIQKTFDYCGYINFDIDSTNDEEDLQFHAAPEFVDVFGEIAAHTTTGILKKPTLKNHEKHGNFTSSETSRHVSKATPKFFQNFTDHDGDCLFSSLCFVLHHLQENTIKDLRQKAADSILQSDTIDDDVLFDETGKTREEYCDEIRNTNAWGGEAEIRAIGKLHGVIVRVISVVEGGGIISSVHVTEFPENEPSFEKCVYIILRNDHYEPLYLCNANNSNEKTTLFDRSDRSVQKILCDFIQEKFHYHRLVEFRFSNKTDGDVHESESHQKVKSVNEFNLIDKNAKKTLSKKRKTPDDDESPFMADTTKKLASSSLSTNKGLKLNLQSSTSSRPIPSNDQIYTQHKENDVPGTIEQLLQTDVFRILNSPIDQPMEQQIKISSNSLPPDITVFQNALNQQMKFETEPILSFRGRLLSEYLPKKGIKKTGEKSVPNKPSYFADRHNRHYLKLLIPETFLCGDLYRIRVEISIITRTIDGCIYIHPYFNFYDLRSVSQPLIVNPLYINLGFDKDYQLKSYSERMQSMLLYLVVIMRKNDELIQNQPIQPFQSSSSNGQAITRKYKNFDEFKNDFHLNDLRFAVTLWIKDIRDNKYHRCPDLQYISEISTQDKNFKVSTANIS